MAKQSSRKRQQAAKKTKRTVVTPSTKPEKSKPATAAYTAPAKKTVDFITEYFYVYQDMRSVLLVSALMFAVLVGLSFAI